MNKITKINERGSWELRSFLDKFRNHKIAILNVQLINDQVVKCSFRPQIFFQTDELSLYRIDNKLKIQPEWIKSISIVVKPLKPVENIAMTIGVAREYSVFDKISYYKLKYDKLTVEEMFGVSEGELVPIRTKFVNFENQYTQNVDANGYQVVKFNMRKCGEVDMIPVVQLVDSTSILTYLNVSIYEQSIECDELVKRLKSTPNKSQLLMIICNALIYGIFKNTPRISNNRKLLVIEAEEVFAKIIKESKNFNYKKLLNTLLIKNNLIAK